MSKRNVTVPALVVAAAVALIATSTLSAASEPGQQRIVLVQRNQQETPFGRFVLYALSPGPLGLDSGTFALSTVQKPPVEHDGQRAAVYVGLETLTGKRGSFEIRWRVEFVSAGDGATVGTGRWWLVRGQGAYADATGGGRLAMVLMTPRGYTNAQFEGLLRLRVVPSRGVER